MGRMTSEAPPPSYSEAVGESISEKEQQSQYQQYAAPPQQQQQQQQQHVPRGPSPGSSQVAINRQFPPSFGVYRTPGLASRTMILGEHQNQPLYAISLHSGWSGQPDVVLHSGLHENTPPMAGVQALGGFNRFNRSSTVFLPPLAADGGAPAGGAPPLAAEMELRFESGGFSNGTHTFTIEVGPPGGGYQRETFEWRHTRGAEVQGLHGRDIGWKLVRLAGPPATNGGNPAAGAHLSSDGREVVAVYTDASMSLSKVLIFRFLGSGATGVLGERWAVAAVITALRIWDKTRKARQAAATASA